MYLPVCEYTYYRRKHYKHLHRKQRYQYTCEYCNQKTKWMNKEEHTVFTKKHKICWSNKPSIIKSFIKT